MKIDTTDPAVAIVENRSIVAPIFGLVFVTWSMFLVVRGAREGFSSNDVFGIVVTCGLGMAIFLYTLRRDRYRFDTRTGEVAWVHQSLFRKSSGTLPLTEIERIEVEEGPEAGDSTWRVGLKTKSHGFLPLTQEFTVGEKRHQEMAQRIEAVLATLQVGGDESKRLG